MGGWSNVKAMRNSGIKEASGERILGNGEFVTKVIENAAEKIKHQLPAIELQKNIRQEIKNQCRKAKVTVARLQGGSRRPRLPNLRSVFTLKLINDYGVSLAETARQVGISTSGVAQLLRASGKIISHFIRRCIPSGDVVKARNISIFHHFHALPCGRLNA